MRVAIIKDPEPAFGNGALPSEVFSFINPDGNTQQGVQLKHPDSSPLPFRAGDQADIDGHTDATGVFHLESFSPITT